MSNKETGINLEISLKGLYCAQHQKKRLGDFK